LKQLLAEVIGIKKVLPGCVRPHARDILGSYLIWLKCPEIGCAAKPGQFVMVRCGNDCALPRPFSIHQVDKEGNIALFFAVWENGKGTNWLAQRCIGNTVELFGPLGSGFSIRSEAKNLLLVAGGTGIAPLEFLALAALKKKKTVTLLYGTANDQRCQISADIRLVSATEDGTLGIKGTAIELIPQFIDQADQIFACGPMAMYHAMARMPELKLKPVQVSLEIMMGCGRGVCYGCTIKTKQGLKEVCQDGPVFDLDDILWDELTC